MADIPIRQYFGTPQTAVSTTTDIAAGTFSVPPTTSFSNSSDALVPYALYGQAMAEFPDWAAAPVAGTVVELWGVLLNTDGSENDTDAPSGSSTNGARYFGAWVIAAADALQRRTIDISLRGIHSTVDFYVRNGTGQSMNNDASTSCVVKITPYTFGVNN